jgi:hypothetical protein
MKARHFLIVAIAASIAIAGCGSSNATVQQASAQKVDTAIQMRKYFDKVRGDFNSLSPTDQAAYNQLAGSAAEGKSTWAFMAKSYRPPAGAAPGGPNSDPRGNTGQ